MTHPEELLAPYVDGSLDASERAVVDAHLAACARCREEVAVARRAVAALSTLGEEPVPLGITAPVLARAERAAPLRSRSPRWAVGLAAAAALVLAGALVLPQVLRGPAGPSPGGATMGVAEDAEREAAELATPGLPPLEVWDADLGERGAKRLALRSARLAPSPAPDNAFAATGGADEALSCLTASGAVLDEQHVLVRLISARYLGTPAYLAVFREGPGGDQPPTRVVVWVVAREDCRILTLLSQRI
jgi:anti-sigma factor RsiW